MDLAPQKKKVKVTHMNPGLRPGLSSSASSTEEYVPSRKPAQCRVLNRDELEGLSPDEVPGFLSRTPGMTLYREWSEHRVSSEYVLEAFGRLVLEAFESQSLFLREEFRAE